MTLPLAASGSRLTSLHALHVLLLPEHGDRLDLLAALDDGLHGPDQIVVISDNYFCR